MNDSEYEAQKARILALRDRWVKPIGLAWWHITYAFSREPLPSEGRPQRHGRDADAWICAAQTSADWKYRHATMTFYVPQWAEFDDDQAELVFVHECMHLFLNECRSMDEGDWPDHEERVASSLASGFIWLREALAPAAPEAPHDSPNGHTERAAVERTAITIRASTP